MIRDRRKPVVSPSGTIARGASILGLALSIGVVALAVALGPGFAGTQAGPAVTTHAVAFEGVPAAEPYAAYASLGGR